MQTEGKTLLLIVKGRIVQIADDTPTADESPRPGTDVLHISLWLAISVDDCS
jgi:hypothetical protein